MGYADFHEANVKHMLAIAEKVGGAGRDRTDA